MKMSFAQCPSPNRVRSKAFRGFKLSIGSNLEQTRRVYRAAAYRRP